MPAARPLAAGGEIILVRPLLTVPRCAILAYLKALEQPFCTDLTNTDPGQTRARIRHDLLRKLAAEYNPKTAEALVRLGALAASAERALNVYVQPLVDDAVLALAPDRVLLNRRSVRSVPQYLRNEVFRRIWQRAGWPEAGMSARRWNRLGRLAAAEGENSRLAVGMGIEASINHTLVVLRRAPGPEIAPRGFRIDQEAKPLVLGGTTHVDWADCEIEADVDPSRECLTCERIDLDQIVGLLRVRAPAAGDRFDPLGMDGNSMALADFFRGRHVPRARRALTPLVCDERGIVWVVGHRIADRVKRTEQTRHVLSLRWRGNPASGADAGRESK
jgi:tRNA(Ile)-lysidine synthase